MRKVFGFAVVALLACSQVFAQNAAQPSPSDVPPAATPTAQTVVEPTAQATMVEGHAIAVSGCGCGTVSNSCGSCATQCNDDCCQRRRISLRRNNNCNTGCNTGCCSAPAQSCGCAAPVATPCCSAPAPSCGCNTSCNDCCRRERVVFGRRNNNCGNNTCCNTGCNTGCSTACAAPAASCGCAAPVAVAPACGCGNTVAAPAAECCPNTRVRSGMPVRGNGLRLRRGC